MNTKYYTPEFKKESFHCPHCGVYSRQYWEQALKEVFMKAIPVSDVYFAFCSHCNNKTIWFNENMIEPNIGGVPLPNQDLSEEIKEDYLEAGDILNKSPRGSAALLRLAIEKLCIELIGKGKTLYQNIGELVKN